MLTGVTDKLIGVYRSSIEMRACGIFYRLASTYYFLPISDVAPDTPLVKGEQLPLSGMFNIWFALDPRGEKVGFLITSSFPMLDKGGVLIASLNKGRGRASVVEVLLKTKDCVIYHFPNRGTMIVSPVMGEQMELIMSEQ